MANYLTVTDFRTYNPTLDLSQYTDATISGMVSRASKYMDSYLNYSLDLETITNEKSDGFVDSDGNLTIFTRKRPIVSISALSLVKGTDAITLNLADNSSNARYDIPSTADRVIFPDNQISTTSVSTIDSFRHLRGSQFFTKITYIGGYQTIPLDLQDACSLIVRDYIARSMNTGGASSISQGGISIRYSERGDGDSDNVRDAKQILNRYRRLTPF